MRCLKCETEISKSKERIIEYHWFYHTPYESKEETTEVTLCNNCYDYHLTNDLDIDYDKLVNEKYQNLNIDSYYL